MTKLMIDAGTLAKLHNLEAPLEVCDESGKTLGYFHPAVLAHGAGPALRSPFSDEELQRRRQQRTGSPLGEVLERLGKS
jgi:hypothetical protein